MEHDWRCFLEANLERLSAFHKKALELYSFNHQSARGPTVDLLYMGLCVIKLDGVKPKGHVDKKQPNTKGFVIFKMDPCHFMAADVPGSDQCQHLGKAKADPGKDKARWSEWMLAVQGWL